MTANLFLIRLPAGQARGVICAEARYVSVLPGRAERPVRRHLSASNWIRLERELASNLPPAPLAPNCAIVWALVDPNVRTSAEVRYMMRVPVSGEPHEIVRQLDALLIPHG